MSIKRIALFTAIMLLFLTSPSWAQKSPDLASPALIINLPSRTIELYSGGEFIKSYPVAIGKPSTPTPLGSYSVIYKEVDPWWFPPGEKYFVPSGPSNPLGYRWMGFGGNYGVHGTNAPWSIGGAVSNGCIRMYEEDVEELYESVPLETPLTITYDRVKVRVNSHGEASIGIYPDIYGYGDISLQEVKDQLTAHNLNGIVSDEFLLNLIQEEPDRQIIIAQLFNIKVNDFNLTEHGILSQNTYYVPALSIAEKLKLNAVWNPDNGVVTFNNNTVAGMLKGNIVYIPVDNVQPLFGGTYHWINDYNLLDLNIPMVYLNGTPVTGDIQKVNNILAVNAIPLAEALSIPGSWNSASKTFTVHGKKLPVSVLDNKPYIQITKIYEYFKAYVYWNELNKTIELTYPFKGGND